MSSSSAPLKIIVAASTGKQGGALVRSLAAINSSLPSHSPNKFSILALTRSPSSPASQSLLALRGVTLLQGDLSDPTAIFASAGPNIHGVFSITPPSGSGGFDVNEARNGKAMAEASLKAGVKHFVATTVERGTIKGMTGVPHFDSKIEIEQRIKESEKEGLGATILQPVMFMDNHVNFSSFMSKMFSTMLGSIRPAKGVQQLVACEDIGRIAGAVFQNPDRYIGRTLRLASDSQTIPELKATYRRVYGTNMPTTFGFFVPLLKAASKEMSTMYKFFDDEGFDADIPALQAEFPEIKLTTWEAYLRARKAAGDK